MNFIILKLLAALWIEQGCAVVGSEPATGAGYQTDDAEQEVALRIARNFLRAPGEIRPGTTKTAREPPAKRPGRDLSGPPQC